MNKKAIQKQFSNLKPGVWHTNVNKWLDFDRYLASSALFDFCPYFLKLEIDYFAGSKNQFLVPTSGGLL